MNTLITVRFFLAIMAALSLTAPASRGAEAKDPGAGGIEQGKGKLTIEFNTTAAGQQKGAFAVRVEHVIQVEREKISASIVARIEVLAGTVSEFPLPLNGDGEIRQVTGEGLQDWSVRVEPNGGRTLVLRPRQPAGETNALVFTIGVEQRLGTVPGTVKPLILTPGKPAVLSGYLSIRTAADLT